VQASRGFSKLEALPEGFAERMRQAVKPGEIIGDRYKIIRAIGGGAMGRIFLAENVAIGLRVAVKLLKPELLAKADLRLRFKQEAEAVAAIQHVNVARFLDLVVDDPTFLVMEYVDGPTLADTIEQEKKLVPRKALDIAARLAWGLHAAHKAGVIHRDLKPANILLEPDDEHGLVPKIIDFGLAKLAAASAKGAPLTRVGQIIGTPHYMAPEQIGGGDIDARIDIYALGCVLYAMLTGRPPFYGPSEDVQILHRQVHDPATPVRRIVPEIDPALEAVVMTALEKNPNARFACARDMALSLEAARSEPRSRAIVSRPSRRRFWIAGAAAALAFGSGAMLARRAPDTLVLVISEPPGAAIELDGKPIADRTPAALHGLRPGEHSLKIKREHYMDFLRTVAVAEHDPQAVNAHLSTNSHSLEVQTVPDGATVLLDGMLVAGKTPLAVQVTDDDYHELRIEMDGYETLTHKIAPEENGALGRFVLKPESQPRGFVYVESSTPAEVWIDGLYSGFLTPTPGLRVTAGEHRVELRSQRGERSEPVPVKVEKGATVRLALPMPTAKKK
jgi:serine/threonine protein kinase